MYRGQIQVHPEKNPGRFRTMDLLMGRKYYAGIDLHESRCITQPSMHQTDRSISATLRCVPCALEI